MNVPITRCVKYFDNPNKSKFRVEISKPYIDEQLNSTLQKVSTNNVDNKKFDNLKKQLDLTRKKIIDKHIKAIVSVPAKPSSENKIFNNGDVVIDANNVQNFNLSTARNIKLQKIKENKTVVNVIKKQKLIFPKSKISDSAKKQKLELFKSNLLKLKDEKLKDNKVRAITKHQIKSKILEKKSKTIVQNNVDQNDSIKDFEKNSHNFNAFQKNRSPKSQSFRHDPYSYHYEQYINRRYWNLNRDYMLYQQAKKAIEMENFKNYLQNIELTKKSSYSNDIKRNLSIQNFAQNYKQSDGLKDQVSFKLQKNPFLNISSTNNQHPIFKFPRPMSLNKNFESKLVSYSNKFDNNIGYYKQHPMFEFSRPMFVNKNFEFKFVPNPVKIDDFIGYYK